MTLSSFDEEKKLTRKQLEDACKRVPRVEQSALIPRRCTSSNYRSSEAMDDTMEGPLNILNTGVNVCARKYNECKALVLRLEHETRKAVDELEGLKKEGEKLQKMIEGEHTEAKEISKLRNDIESRSADSDSDLHYRKRLEHMYQRQHQLSSQMSDYNNRLTKELLLLNREQQKCQQMLNDVEISLGDATRTFQMTKETVGLERMERRRLLGERRTDAKNIKIMDQWRQTQETNNDEFDHAIIHSYQTEKDMKLNKIREKEAELKALSKSIDTESCTRRSSDDILIKVKSATGIMDVGEMGAMFFHHKSHSARLNEEKKEAENRFRGIKDSFDSFLHSFQKMKTEIHEIHLGREVVSNLSEQISIEKSRTKVIKSTSERLEGVLVGLRQGTTGLYQRIVTFHSTLLEGNAPVLCADADAMQAARDTLEMLKVAEQILGKMLDTVGGVDAINSAHQYHSAREKDGESAHDQESTDLGCNNCRIQPKVRFYKLLRLDFES